MIRVGFEVRKEYLNSVGRYFCSPLRSDITNYPLNFSDFKYRNFFKIDYGDSSMALSFCFNGTKKEDILKGYFEVNPNKTFDSLQLKRDLAYLLSRCAVYEIKRWDLAIDIPIERENVHMKKDQRKFELTQTSFENRTEYLGQRSQIGRVKLYNKTLESQLEYSLTRLEVTLGDFDSFNSDFDRYIPQMWINTSQLGFEDFQMGSLGNTQKVLVDLLRDVPQPELYLSRLDYRIRKKIEPYVFGRDTRLMFDSVVAKSIITQIIDELKELSLAPVFKADNDIQITGWVPVDVDSISFENPN